MTMTPTDPAPMKLGIGSILGDTFATLGRHLPAVMILSAVPILALDMVQAAMNGGLITLVTGFGSDFEDPTRIARIAVTVVLQFVVFGLIAALLVQLAYDAKLGRPITPGRYIRAALPMILPLSVLSVVSSVLTGLGFVALIVPGLWVVAVFSVTSPAVVIERAGWGGLTRSAALTKGYRWPIVGAMLVVGIVTWVLAFVGQKLAVALLGDALVETWGILTYVAVVTLAAAIGQGLTAISAAMIYARLREIKEGTSLRDIVSVFD